MGAPVTGPRLSVVTMSEVRPEQVEWLWPGRLPVGKIVVLDGDPGTGKSTLTLDLAAHLSTGADWPDGAPCPLGGTVLLSAEDGLADTISLRLLAAGADLARVHAFTQVGDRPPHLGDVESLRAVIERYQARLLVVDVLMAYLPTDGSRDQAVRRLLHPLGAMAEEMGCCVLLLRHLIKASGGNVLYRGSGSVGVIGAARAAFLVGRDPQDQTLMVLAGVKTNLAAMPDALGYRLISPSSLRAGVLRATDLVAALRTRRGVPLHDGPTAPGLQLRDCDAGAAGRRGDLDAPRGSLERHDGSKDCARRCGSCTVRHNRTSPRARAKGCTLGDLVE